MEFGTWELLVNAFEQSFHGWVYYTEHVLCNFKLASVAETLVTIQKKTIEQYFHAVLFIMLYKVVLAFKSVDREALVCDQMKATEQYFHVALLIE